MTPQQAITILSSLINSPILRLSLPINDLAACDLAVRTLADALKPKPEPVEINQPT